MKQEAILKKKKLDKKEKLEGYEELLGDVRILLEKAKYNAYRAIDNLRVQTYWQIGDRILREELKHKDRADYGEEIIERLAIDLCFSSRILYKVVQFYKTYPILPTVSAQLSWSHYEALMSIVNNEKRQFYEQQTIQNTWSVRELRKQVRSKLYERTKKKGAITVTKPITKIMQPEQIFKDVYNFDFLKISEEHTETELKTALLNNLVDFLSELGPDFFIGRREVPILINGNMDKIDLVLFHSTLLCYILVEIKTEQFKHSHVSQMYSYLNWYKENKWYEGQKQPIGLIICKTKDEETVHYALGDLKEEIFVSEYKTKLPSEEEIEENLRGYNE